MKDLHFQKKGNHFFAEFEASNDFNLHLERERSGAIYLQQKTVEDGEYDSVHNLNIANADLVFDADFTALVYPKYIRVVSSVEPTRAVITFATNG